MRKLITVTLIVSVIYLLNTCSKQKESTEQLQVGTPEYELAQDVSETIPFVNPDKNRVLATTKYFDLTVADFFREFYQNAGKRAQQLTQFNKDQLNNFIRQTTQNIIEKRLLLREARQTGLAISDTAVDSVLENQYQRAGSKEKFVEFLSGQDVTLETVKNSIREGLLIQKYLDQKIKQDIEVSEQEIIDNYTGVKSVSARHILLKTPDQSDSAKQSAYNKAKEVLAQAKSGQDFAELAEKYSEGPSAKNGGDLGQFQSGDMVQPFEEAAFKLKVGEISDIVETRFGYHIIKVYDKEKQRPLEEVHDQIEEQLKNQKMENEYRDFVQKLVQDAEIEVKI